VYRVRGKFALEPHNYTLENDIKVDLRAVGEGVPNYGALGYSQMASTLQHVNV